ncbi:conserved hypothetical protein [sediment metagenome]|uniref:Uncharacterized protein n=1 Tax=sediment metagenome TaxID=749907 RepID=D9PHW1_9ZZZZ
MTLNNPEATQQALKILRSGDQFQWYVIPLLVIVIYIYANEYEKGNYRVIAGGLALYMVHWFVEIINALIQHFSGHALWTVSSGTAFEILVGVGIEISLMFSIAGIAVCKLMPKDPKQKIFGLNNRLVFTVGNAALASILEIFLVRTPAFVWVYGWWGTFPVFVTVYIPFFAAACYGHDWDLRKQKLFIGSLFAINAIALIVFGAFLKWI